MKLTKNEEKQLMLEIIEIKKDILKMIYQSQSGHPGGSLSCASIIHVLYSKIMRYKRDDPQWEDRDTFILSKGHAAPALYAVLCNLGCIKEEEMCTLRHYGSILQGHPLKNEELGIEITTGSLGMGLSIGLGCALAAKLDKKSKKYIYVLLGDGELNEGAIWEAAMAASHYKTDNLIAIVDRNGIQIDGSTEEVMALEPLADKWRAFGWDVKEVDGSNLSELIQALESSKKILKKPKVLISYLIKGSDISFMEHTNKFHGRPPNREEYEAAMGELDFIATEISEGNI
ncbi:MAG: transketolase [Candidatus Lokiarchaeota archaeon]|nr:transketolase [Candidatus Lokiarchaeota archaeon]